jgi:hypothetical protein
VAISEEIYRLIWIGSGEEGRGDSVLEVYKEGFRVLWSKGFLMRRNSQTIFLASVEGSRYLYSSCKTHKMHYKPSLVPLLS